MTSTKEILKLRIKKKIKELKKDGITSMSKKNMKMLISTSGLICQASEYHTEFNEACLNFPEFLYD